MATAQLYCPSCNRRFSPRGLSQHISKSPDPLCRNSTVAPHFQFSSTSISHTAFLLGAADRQEVLIGSPELMDTTGADAFDNLGSDGEIDAGSDDESAASCFMDQCEGSPDDGLGMQLPDGEFGTTCVAIRPKGSLTDTDPTAPGEDLIGPESADAMDADAFEVLTQGTIHPVATIPDQCSGDGTTGDFEAPATPAMVPTIHFDVPDAETPPAVIIDHFLLGKAGAPIPGALQGVMAHELDQAAATETAWAPFNSQCDWKIAHWAKTCGATSSAVTDLLAIDGVSTLFKSNILLLIRHLRL